jgi:hypothetical protein
MSGIGSIDSNRAPTRALLHQRQAQELRAECVNSY